MAVPQYLNWSSTLTFNLNDHPDRVVAPGVYLLIIDPIIINTRLSKVLMDGGSILNIIYLETLDLLGIERAQLQPSAGSFHGVVPGKRHYRWVEPTYRSVLARWPTSGRKPSLLKWWVFEAPITPSSGAQDTPSLWRSPTTLTSS